MEDGSVAGAQKPVESFLTELDAVRRTLELARGDDPAPAAELVLNLETAYEELRVADEEVRVQQAQIEGLLDDRRVLRWQHERMLTALPVAVLATDSVGIVRTANPAAGDLFGSRVARLLGKPVMALFDAGDRSALRGQLAAQDREGGTGFHATVTVVRPVLLRDATTTTPSRPVVEVTVSPTLGQDGGLTWLMLPRRGDEQGDPALPLALTGLAALSTYVGPQQELLAQLVSVSRPAFGADVELSITVGPPEQPEAVATTSALAQEMDGAQLRVGEGPCVSAFATLSTVRSPDVRTDPRWPKLSPLVPDEVGAVVAAPLEVGEELVGALNLYRRQVGWDAGLVEAAELVAATIASVLYERGVRDELESLAADMSRALDSRGVIDQAKGIVMADKGCDADRAFAHLVEVSSQTGVKVRDVARMLVEQVGSGRQRQR